MLYSINELFEEADRRNFAYGAFNFANAETVMAVLEASSELKTDAMLIGSGEENVTFGLEKWVELV